jgi:uncharacterized metal-binding protein YceD (DUF177 family)
MTDLEMTTPELHRPIAVDRIGPNGLDLTVQATPRECAALALRMGLPAVHALVCDFHLTRGGQGRVLAQGRLRARISQTCVVTLEDFDADLEEAFQVRFVPEDELSEAIDLEDDDEIPFEGTTIDLGEAAAEQLGLALDPYPRMPGAELEVPPEEDDSHPFAGLSGLRRLN